MNKSMKNKTISWNLINVIICELPRAETKKKMLDFVAPTIKYKKMYIPSVEGAV